MSVLNPLERASDAPEGVSIGPVTPAQRRAAMALLLTGRTRAADDSVDQFLAYAATHDLSLDTLWCASRGGHPVVTTLVVRCAGRTAMCFVSPLQSDAYVPFTARLVREACASLPVSEVHLAQALMEPGQVLEARGLEQAGFQRLAHLTYMQRSVIDEMIPLDLGDDLSVCTYSAQTRGAFAQGILASYQDTLDCPQLLGLRDIDDIVDGHMATGQFDPRLWLCVQRQGEPMGVILLNQVPLRRSVELVYLGLAPAARGQGFGRTLLRHGLWLSSQHEARTMLLAVDELNTPAVTLYRTLGFRATSRKLAMIMSRRPQT